MAIKAKITSILKNHALKIRFLFVGGINTVVGVGLFPILYYCLPSINSHYLLLLSLSHFLALNFSFFTNKFFVFKTSGNYFYEYIKFVAYQLVILLVYLGPFAALIEVGHLHPVASQLTLSGTIFIISYFWYNNIVFGKKS